MEEQPHPVLSLSLLRVGLLLATHGVGVIRTRDSTRSSAAGQGSELAFTLL